MRVKAVKDFEMVLIGVKLLVKKGSEFDLPRYGIASEWLQAGLVVPVREQAIETAVRTPQERAITR